MNAPHRFVPDPRVEAAIEFGLSLKLDAPWETNGQGQIIMGPRIGLPHAKRAGRIAVAIRSLLNGSKVWPKVGIHTAEGVRGPIWQLRLPTSPRPRMRDASWSVHRKSASRSCLLPIPGRRCAARRSPTSLPGRKKCGYAKKAARFISSMAPASEARPPWPAG